MKFLLDTNFLMAVGQFRLDVFEQLKALGKPELYSLDLVVEELGKIAESGGRDASHARLAMELIREKGIAVLKSREANADDELERRAGEGFVVCTQDRALLERLKRKGLPAARIEKKHIISKV